MTIRQATVKDAEAIAIYILLAMGDIIYQFTGVKDDDIAKHFMQSLIAGTNNQYSYENCWVAEEGNKIIAAACIYDGARLKELRRPVLDYVKNEYHNILVLEEETQAGEFYIDSIGVDPGLQGKGIGSEMLRFLIDEYVTRRRQTLGLLVDGDNPAAKRLYLKLGFETIRYRDFAGKKMEHLQISA